MPDLEWVHAVERAYVAAGTGHPLPDPDVPADHDSLVRAAAAAGAVASHYLAVGTPRTFGLVIDAPGDWHAAATSLAAHRAWFSPKDVRCACVADAEGADDLAAAVGGRAVTVAEAFGADIVCVHAPSLSIEAAMLRAGTHVNVLARGVRLGDSLAQLAVISRERADLPALAAGLVDGRQLDERTVFVLDDARIALAALLPR